MMSADLIHTQPIAFDIYRLYLSTAEKVSDRRAATNRWMLSVNGAIVGLHGLLEAATSQQNSYWLGIVPLAGILVSISWVGLLLNYRKLNSAKFKVLQDIETGFPFQPFTDEQKYYQIDKRSSASAIEQLVPWSFALLFVIVLVLAYLT